MGESKGGDEPAFAFPPIDVHLSPILLQLLSSPSSSSSLPSSLKSTVRGGQAQGDFTSHVVVKMANGWKNWRAQQEKVRMNQTMVTEDVDMTDADASAPNAASAPSASSSVPSSRPPFDLPSALSSWSSLLCSRFHSSLLTSPSPEFLGITAQAGANGYLNFFVDKERKREMVERERGGKDAATSSFSSSSSDPSSPAFATSPHLSTASSFAFTALGTFESIFHEKHGTPRQGCVVSGARGRLVLADSLSVQSLDGLEEFTHVWLMFVFHQNGGEGFGNAKVKPPRAGGQKVGLFATRSPHRPNPIGLSLARLDRVVGRVIHFSGVDLIHGTPVVDIKPYHPADCVEEFRRPRWVNESNTSFLQVRWEKQAQEELCSAVEKGMEFYSKEEYEVLHACISSLISQDPRTLHSKSAHSEGGIYGICVDRVDVCFRMEGEEVGAEGRQEDETMEDSEVTATVSAPASSPSPSSSLPSASIFHITYHPVGSTRAKLRTKEWLEGMKKLIEKRK
jgi:tRNA-Thr(GGU) m(6)t(6)A37 methyltransferase TsaA